MYRRMITVMASLTGFIGGCTSRTSPPPVPTPATPQVPGPDQPGARVHRFSPNTYRYYFNQSADIRGNGPADTVTSSITTRAVLLVRVAGEPDSTVTVTMSVDSISITSQGSIPARGLQQISLLDSVLSATFSRSGVLAEGRLPDSLCAYSQFVSAARELLLPELGIQLQSPTKQAYRDTVTQQACRAGTMINLVTVRELRDLNRNPTELALQQRTEMQGGGLLHRDSISVSGSIVTRGTVSFTTGDRLPSLIRSASEGTITVQLGSTTTVFRQTSRQETRREQ